MEREKESLYERIKNNLVDGELPGDFSLSPRKDKNEITFADGARDGIAIYHMGSAEVTGESMQLLDRLMRDISEGRFEEGERGLLEFAEKNTPLNAIDDFEQYIVEHAGELNAERLYKFLTNCLQSSHVDLVKYGMEMLEVFSQPGEEQKQMIRILGLCDEFTIFSIFNMLSWENANDEIFALAKKVHGWGRIHAVEKLEPENDEIREWLLKEGIDNRVVADYSALEVYEKAEVAKLLSEEPAAEELDEIAAIIRALLSEGPVAGISEVEDADGMLLKFIAQAERHCSYPSLAVCSVVHELAGSERSGEVVRAAQEFLRRTEVTEAVRHWIWEEEDIPIEAVSLARFLGVDYDEPLYACMERDFDRYFHQCNILMENDTYQEKVLALFRKKLPMEEMVAGPEDCLGLGKEYANYSILGYLVQSLADYPMCGEDFVALALRSPVVSNRNMALRALNSWCRAKDCSLEALSEKLAQNVHALKEKECSESVLKNMEEYGF